MYINTAIKIIWLFFPYTFGAITYLLDLNYEDPHKYLLNNLIKILDYIKFSVMVLI